MTGPARFALLAGAGAGLVLLFSLRGDDGRATGKPTATRSATAARPAPGARPAAAPALPAAEDAELAGAPAEAPEPDAPTPPGASSSPTIPGPPPPPLVTTNTPVAQPPVNPNPLGLSPAEQRAYRIRLLLDTRTMVASIDGQLADGGDAKLRTARDEEQAHLVELERWADQNRVTAAELALQRERLAADRPTTAVAEPPRPR